MYVCTFLYILYLTIDVSDYTKQKKFKSIYSQKNGGCLQILQDGCTRETTENNSFSFSIQKIGS